MTKLKLNEFTNNKRKEDTRVEKYKGITIYKCDALKRDLLEATRYYSTFNRCILVSTIAEVKKDIDWLERSLKRANRLDLFYEEEV